MSALNVYSDSDASQPLFSAVDHDEISEHLSAVGVRFERWQAAADVGAGDSQEAVMAAYREDIDCLVSEAGYLAVDVISLDADQDVIKPQVPELRKKFLSEHSHSEDEVRFFVDGKGLFSLHINDRVFEVLCEKGDLISVPANTPHWFDMGPAPKFVAIRFFNNPEGWVANYTGSPIAGEFSRLE